MCFVSKMWFVVNFDTEINFWKWLLLVCFSADDDIRNMVLISRRGYLSAVCFVI